MINTLKQLVKFGLVGCLNTAITIGSIFIMTKVFNLYYLYANVIGYILGLINSYFFNRNWTFKSNGKVSHESIKFIIVFGITYTIQLGLLIFFTKSLNFNEDISQLITMVIYTVINFILSKLFTFKRRKNVS